MECFSWIMSVLLWSASSVYVHGDGHISTSLDASDINGTSFDAQGNSRPWLYALENCVSKRQGSDVDLHCVIPDNTRWNFSLVRYWTENRTLDNIDVHVSCEATGRVILRQPVKVRGLRKLHIESCHIEHFYAYDLSSVIDNIPDTIRVMIVTDSVFMITFTELEHLYRNNSKDILSKYPCFIPPSLVSYTQRNVTTESIMDRHASKQDRLMLRVYQTRHYDSMPKCNYTHLIYYEKSKSKRSMYTFTKSFLEKGIFPVLEVMNFSRLHLNRVPDILWKDTALENCPSLKTVDLSNNRLSNITFGTFTNTYKRNITIDMSNNTISVVNTTCLSIFYPGVIVLYDNPWHCQCQQRQELIHFLDSSTQPIVKHYHYLKDERCVTPLSHRGRTLGTLGGLCKHVDTTSVKYHPANTIIIITSISAFILVLGVCVACCRNVNRFRYTKFRRKRQQAINIEDKVPEFDAFVSYSHKDRTWVNTLCGRLEGPPYHVTLCLHERHFMPGVGIADNIYSAVNSSRRTVVVLSENYLTSEWCVLEFREAFHKSFLDCQRHLVVILLDDIDATSMHQYPDIELFLQIHTYIRVSDDMFWDKLVNVLSYNN